MLFTFVNQGLPERNLSQSWKNAAASAELNGFSPQKKVGQRPKPSLRGGGRHSGPAVTWTKW
jgi:hypothetical protein